MVLESINSSNIEAAGFDPIQSKMVVRFKSGAYYEYLSVPQQIYEQFRGAQSKGIFFNQNIKNYYNCNRIEVD
jgi:hypothetical protein